MRYSMSFVARRPLSLGLAALVLVAGLGGLARLWSAPLTEPRPSDREVISEVIKGLQEKHVSRHPLDDEISHRGFDKFLSDRMFGLDPMKLYFNQSDVDEFAKRRDDLDDMLKKRDVSLAYAMHKRFLERVEERVKLADELLKEKHDFTIEEEFVTDPELVRFPRDAKEAHERWRKRIKFDLLMLKVDKIEGQAAIDKLTRRYHSFAKRMNQTDGDELLEKYLSSITTSYDPHTTYMSPSALAQFQILMRLNLDGIGAALQSVDGETVVSSLVPGGAAEKQGKLKTGDKIVSVGEGAAGEMVDVQDMKLDDVVKRIRGKAGSVVKLGVTRATGGETEVFAITRARIELQDSAARGIIFDDAKKADGTPLKIGVINLPSFYRDFEGTRRDADFKSSTRDVKKILEDFNAKKVDAVVLDLRQNGGGSLEESIDLTGLFIDKGPVVQVKDPDGKVQGYDDDEAGAVWDGPLVVLCSKLSASASEILAGAIQDYRRGLVIGDDSTHGKGTVQQMMQVGARRFPFAAPPNLGALKITIQQFYRPNGDSTQKRGVVSDLVLPSLLNNIKGLSEGDLEYALNFDRVPASDFNKLSQVNEDLIGKLKADSVARRAKSEHFAKLLSNIEKYKIQREKKTVTLNEKEFFAQRAEFDADKEDEKIDDEVKKNKDEVVKRDFYFDEVLNITADYARALQGNKVARAK